MPKTLNWKFIGSFESRSEFDEYLNNDGAFASRRVRVTSNTCYIYSDGHPMKAQYGFCNNVVYNVIETSPMRYLTLTCLQQSFVEKQKVNFFTTDEYLAKQCDVNKIQYGLSNKV